MKISDIINENFSGSFASVAMPMTPGTRKEDAKRSVYGKQSKPKTESKKKQTMGYSAEEGNLSYTNPVKTQLIKR